MSVISALFTGVSGLQTYGDSLQVIGDNIANVNTVGFKASRAEFTDLLSQALAGGSGGSQIGRGVALETVSADFSQGSFSNTNRLTDMAINGNGFFIVNDGGRDLYTRNGQFTLNADGELVNSSGFTVQGYQFDPTGQPLNTIGPLSLTQSTAQPNATGDGTNGSGVKITLNLDQRTPNSAEAFDVTNATGTSDFSTAITVFDGAGARHSMNIYFNKTNTDNQWSWHAVVDSADLGLAGGTPTQGGTGTLLFTETGALKTVTGTSAQFDFLGTGTAQEIGMSFGESIDDGNTSGLGGTTQFASPYSIFEQGQDGFASGSLASLQVTQDGLISGVYTNGRSIPIGQVALANFANLQGLSKSSSGMYTETTESGVPIIGAPESGGFGSVTAFSLELSNVDLANEFVNLISTQRAYQANSRIITVGDQLLSDIVNIIR